MTLGALLAHAGAGLLEASLVHGGLDVEVNRPVVVGGMLDDDLYPGDLVLMVGVDVDDPVSEEILEAARKAEVAAVIVRAEGGLPTRMHAAAEKAGVNVLCSSPGVTWDQLYLFVDAALSRPGGITGTTVADVPVGDLFALANAVAAVVGGPVTVEDAHSQVLAFSSQPDEFDEPRRQSILGRRTPEKWVRKFRDAGVFQRFSAGDDIVHIDRFIDEGLRPRLVVPIRAGGEVLGSIWAAQGDRPFGPESEVALAEAGRIAAVHLLRTRATSELERHMRGDLLRSLFEGVAHVDVVSVRLGIDPTTPVAVVALRALGADKAHEAAERTLPLVRLMCDAFHRRSSCIADDGAIHVLLPVTGSLADVRHLVEEIVERVESGLGIELAAGIGSVVPGLAEAARSRTDADEVLTVLATQHPARRVADVEELSTGIVLARLQGLLAGLRLPHAAHLDALIQYDSVHQTGYVSTLEAWLKAFGDAGRAAAELDIHPNTLRYRLRRLSELVGFDLHDPDERLALHVELEVCRRGADGP